MTVGQRKELVNSIDEIVGLRGVSELIADRILLNGIESVDADFTDKYVDPEQAKTLQNTFRFFKALWACSKTE